MVYRIVSKTIGRTPVRVQVPLPVEHGTKGQKQQCFWPFVFTRRIISKIRKPAVLILKTAGRLRPGFPVRLKLKLAE